MKDFEAFPHSALVFQKTCDCCGKTIFWEKSWAVLCPPHPNTKYICRHCAETAKEAEEWFRKKLMDKKPKSPPPPGQRVGQSPLSIRMAEATRTMADFMDKDYKHKSYSPGEIKHIGFGTAPGEPNNVTLIILLETTQDLKRFIQRFPKGRQTIVHTKDGKLKSISFGD
jgi:uncharacterized Zn finger protein (UPF0148 family)